MAPPKSLTQVQALLIMALGIGPAGSTCRAVRSSNRKMWSATAGNIAAWKKKEGEQVSPGDSIAEIETDKVGP